MQLQTKFRIWAGLLTTALLIDGYMTFLFSRGIISAGELALSVIIVHSVRGTLSTFLIGSAIFDVYKKRNEFLRMILDIDERWQDVAIVSIILLVCAYLYGISLQPSTNTEPQQDAVEEVFREEIELFRKDTVRFEADIQKTMADFEKEIAKTVER
jgi:hypothetical protein